MRVFQWTALLTMAVLMNVVSTAAHSADIRLFSSNAMTDAMHELTPLFETATGHRVIGVYEPTNLILERLARGEAADMVILIKPTLQELAKKDQLVAGSEADIARTQIAVAVRSGAAKPDISTVEAFKKAMLASPSIAISKVGASGIQFTRALEKTGIYEQVKPRLQTLDGAVRTGEVLAKGGAVMAIQMKSELASVPGIEVIGPLPGDLNYEIVLSAALLKGTPQAGASSELIRFMTTPSAAASLRGKGMDAR